MLEKIPDYDFRSNLRKSSMQTSSRERDKAESLFHLSFSASPSTSRPFFYMETQCLTTFGSNYFLHLVLFLCRIKPQHEVKTSSCGINHKPLLISIVVISGDAGLLVLVPPDTNHLYTSAYSAFICARLYGFC